MATKPQILRREAVLGLLKLRGPQGATARQVSEHLGMHYTTASDDLHVLQDEDKVISGVWENRTRLWVAL